MDFEAILAELRSMANPANAAGMARFGIRGGQLLDAPSCLRMRRHYNDIARRV